MARYLVQVPKDTLSLESKTMLVAAIGETHREVTGRDPLEVEVAITEIDAGCYFANGRLLECDHIFVHGYLPEAYLLEGYRARLMERLAETVKRAADFREEDAVWVAITGVPVVSM